MEAKAIGRPYLKRTWKEAGSSAAKTTSRQPGTWTPWQASFLACNPSTGRLGTRKGSMAPQPLLHNNQRQVGAGRLLIWAQILVSSDCKTPWLGSHPGPRFQYHEGQNTFLSFCHNNQRQVGAGRPPTRHQVVSGVAPSKSC